MVDLSRESHPDSWASLYLRAYDLPTSVTLAITLMCDLVSSLGNALKLCLGFTFSNGTLAIDNREWLIDPDR